MAGFIGNRKSGLIRFFPGQPPQEVSTEWKPDVIPEHRPHCDGSDLILGVKHPRDIKKFIADPSQNLGTRIGLAVYLNTRKPCDDSGSVHFKKI